jgi:hypothetical protein
VLDAREQSPHDASLLVRSGIELGEGAPEEALEVRWPGDDAQLAVVAPLASAPAPARCSRQDLRDSVDVEDRGARVVQGGRERIDELGGTVNGQIGRDSRQALVAKSTSARGLGKIK